jgi:hypothetical protein
MKRTLFNISRNVSQVNAQQVRVVIAIGTLILFALGAGAPIGNGDF